MNHRDLPIVLAVCKNLQHFVWQIDDFYYRENKDVKRIRQGEFVVNNVRYIFISFDRLEQMLGFHGVKVEIWGPMYGIEQEKLDLLKHYRQSAERP